MDAADRPDRAMAARVELHTHPRRRRPARARSGSRPPPRAEALAGGAGGAGDPRPGWLLPPAPASLTVRPAPEKVGAPPRTPPPYEYRSTGPTARSPHPSASSFGATCFLRLMTPGRLTTPSAVRLPERPLQRRAVAGDEQLGSLGQDVGDHQREQRVAPRRSRASPSASSSSSLALQQRPAHGLDLRDADRLPAGHLVLLGVARDDLARRARPRRRTSPRTSRGRTRSRRAPARARGTRPPPGRARWSSAS